jgi:ArsR family transcriptional regulator, virulence genes transcriptional regulator
MKITTRLTFRQGTTIQGNYNIFVTINVNSMEIRDLNPESLEKASGMLKAIAHPVRISIIGYLEKSRNRTVTEIHKSLGIEQSAASHHLGILKDKGVLSSRREGKNTYYFLKNDNILLLLTCIGECCNK